MSEPKIITIEVGPQDTYVALGADVITNIDSFPTDPDFDVHTANVESAVGRLGLTGPDIDAIGYSIAAPLSPDRQSIELPRRPELSGWAGKRIVQATTQALGNLKGPVVLFNSAESAAYAQRDADRIARTMERKTVGIVQTIGSGVSAAVYSRKGVLDLGGIDLGNVSTGRAVPYPYTGADPKSVEAWVSGDAINAQTHGAGGENIPHNSPFWDTYRAHLTAATEKQLEILKGLGIAPTKLHLLGSVALKGPNIISHLDSKLPISVSVAKHGNNSGLAGSYRFIREQMGL